jgi:hypothetical protein
VRFDAASPAEPAADRTVALAPAGGEEIEASGRTACSSAAGSDSRANKRSRRGRWLGLHREIALRVAGYAPQLLQLKAAVH